MGDMAHVQGFCLLFELGQSLGEIGVRGCQCAHAYEAAHDLDVHCDGARATQYRGQHGHALLGKDVGDSASTATAVV